MSNDGRSIGEHLRDTETGGCAATAALTAAPTRQPASGPERESEFINRAPSKRRRPAPKPPRWRPQRGSADMRNDDTPNWRRYDRVSRPSSLVTGYPNVREPSSSVEPVDSGYLPAAAQSPLTDKKPVRDSRRPVDVPANDETLEHAGSSSTRGRTLKAHEQRCGGRRNDGPVAVECDPFRAHDYPRVEAHAGSPHQLAWTRARRQEHLDAAADIVTGPSPPASHPRASCRRYPAPPPMNGRMRAPDRRDATYQSIPPPTTYCWTTSDTVAPALFSESLVTRVLSCGFA